MNYNNFSCLTFRVQNVSTLPNQNKSQCGKMFQYPLQFVKLAVFYELQNLYITTTKQLEKKLPWK